MPDSLQRKLAALVETLTPNELDNYRRLLGLAAGQLAPAYGSVPQGVKDDAFDALQHSLRHFVAADLLYRGRPPFLTDDVLAALQAEAEEGKRTAGRSARQLIGCGGAVADAFAVSPELLSFVNAIVPGGVDPTGIASYVHYDARGMGIDPHADTDVFTLSVLIMLKHYWENERSHLVIYPAGKPMERIALSPGEVVVMDAGGLIHGREDLHDGESVSLLTIGFKPLAGHQRVNHRDITG